MRGKMPYALTDSGREATATDSTSLASSHHSSNATCSTCTDSSDMNQSCSMPMPSSMALKVPNARQTARKQKYQRAQTSSNVYVMPPPVIRAGLARSRGGTGSVSSGGWVSVGDLTAYNGDDVGTRCYQNLRKASSLEDSLDETQPRERSVRNQTQGYANTTPARPRFIFSRYNPQFRTLPAGRILPHSKFKDTKDDLPPLDLPIRKSFRTLQNFRRTAEGLDSRSEMREKQAPQQSAWNTMPFASVPIYSQAMTQQSAYSLALSSAAPSDIFRIPGDLSQELYGGEWRLVHPASEETQVMTNPSAFEHRMERDVAAVEQRWKDESDSVDELAGELVVASVALKRWYQAVTIARTLGLILPLYQGLLEHLDPVILSKLLFKVSEGRLSCHLEPRK